MEINPDGPRPRRRVHRMAWEAAKAATPMVAEVVEPEPVVEAKEELPRDFTLELEPVDMQSEAKLGGE